MGLSIGFFAIFALFGSIDYATVFSLGSFMNETAITIIGLLLLTGAMAKSSQIPLHSWLPGSMEGSRSNILIIMLITFLFFILPYFKFCFDYFIEIIIYNTNIINLIIMNASLLPVGRDQKDRFKGKSLPLVPLPSKITEALVGDLLGDGHLRFTHKDKNGEVKGNAHYAMTLKHFDYAFYLWKEIYSPICTLTPLRPWPNPIKTGKNPTQFAFSSKSLTALTELHNQWYELNTENKKFVKIVPLNIGDLLTPLGLAHWLMGDGYWNNSAKTVVLCTDNFTLSEVELLITVLKSKFNLTATTQRRMKSNKEICWRIRFSGKYENINLLRTLVQPHFIPLMFYKLNIFS